jgi:hypothetical protein
MSGRTRLLILKLAIVLVPLALALAAMHVFLPGCAHRREAGLLGANYASQDLGRFQIVLPRGSTLAPVIARGMEAFTAALYAEYGQALTLQPITDRITIRLFASKEDLGRFAGSRLKQDLSDADGFYDPVSWSIAIALRPGQDPLATLFHEATHLLMDRSATLGTPDWSPWLAEGMAVFFEHSAVAGGRLLVGGLDRRVAAHVLALARQGRHVPLRQLVGGDRQLFRSDAAPLCYEESGLLVAYLLTGAGRPAREAFLRYIDFERQPGPTPPGTLESSLGVPLDSLERNWLAFLQRIAP